jgi:hypothetical protein
MREANVELSVSTWQQPMPPPPGAERARVLERIVEMPDALGDHRPTSRARDSSGPGSTGRRVANVARSPTF